MKKTLTIFFCALAFSLPAYAQEDSQTEHMSAKFLSAYEGPGNLLTLDMGIDVVLEDGWYTYWRMPGDSGVAPSFDWTGSTNVKDVKVSWPTPKRFAAMDMYSFGYDKEILFPLTVTPERQGQPISLKLKLDTVICHEICIPATLTLSKTLDGKNASHTPEYSILKSARDHLPSIAKNKKLDMNTAVIGKDSVVVTAFSRDGFEGADLIIDSKDSLLTSPPEIIVDEKDKQHAVLKIHAPQGMDLSKSLFGKKVTIVLIHGGDALEKEFTF